MQVWQCIKVILSAVKAMLNAIVGKVNGVTVIKYNARVFNGILNSGCLYIGLFWFGHKHVHNAPGYKISQPAKNKYKVVAGCFIASLLKMLQYAAYQLRK